MFAWKNFPRRCLVQYGDDPTTCISRPAYYRGNTCHLDTAPSRMSEWQSIGETITTPHAGGFSCHIQSGPRNRARITPAPKSRGHRKPIRLSMPRRVRVASNNPAHPRHGAGPCPLMRGNLELRGGGCELFSSKFQCLGMFLYIYPGYSTSVLVIESVSSQVQRNITKSTYYLSSWLLLSTL